jgi:hypothetical protein
VGYCAEGHIARVLDNRDIGKPRHKGRFDDSKQRVTLKFRAPDLIVAAEALPLKGKAKFEEDITPLPASYS